MQNFKNGQFSYGDIPTVDCQQSGKGIQGKKQTDIRLEQ